MLVPNGIFEVGQFSSVTEIYPRLTVAMVTKIWKFVHTAGIEDMSNFLHLTGLVVSANLTM